MANLSLVLFFTWISGVLGTASQNSRYTWPHFDREVTQIPKLHERLLENFKTSKPQLPMVLMRPCLQNPCHNGGRCTYDIRHGVRCLCTHLYVGENCEHLLPPPSNVTMTQASADSVTVAWTGPKVPIKISGFRVQYNMFGDGLTLYSPLIHPSVYNYSITGLLPRTQYTVCVNIVLHNITMREAILREQCMEIMTTDEYISNLNWKTVTVLAAILVFIFAVILIIALMIQRRRLLKYYIRTVKITPPPAELTKKIEITKLTNPNVISNTLPMHIKTTVCNGELPILRKAETQTCDLDRVDVVDQQTQTPPYVERHTKPRRGKPLSSCSGYSSNSSNSSSSVRYTSLPSSYPFQNNPPVPNHININIDERKLSFNVAAKSDTTQKHVSKVSQRTMFTTTTKLETKERENEDSDNDAPVPYFLPRFNTLYKSNSLRGVMDCNQC
ncbi:uncharacterized protein LOC117115641 [Anneissia japonica]|uniref:uncharacterized protein LOC117115641 n=1 Tax=Anneissia japonica TaxID=1529436 RepID=UPI0014259E7D|nr:uncharacterized protein LOC117115641 [Anneissia japonica]